MNSFLENYFGRLLVLAFALSQPAWVMSQSPVVIDFNPDNGRGDVITPGTVAWPVASQSHIERVIDGVTIQLTAIGDKEAKLVFGWWKAGFDYPATLVSDGVTTTASDMAIKLTIRGLVPGRHTLTTWHNQVEGAPGPMKAEYAGRQMVVTPSLQVLHDDDAQTHHLLLEQKADESVEILFRPATGQRVIINGLSLDRIDPAKQVRRMSPADGDEHVPTGTQLTWQAPRDTSLPRTMYQVYFGTEQQRVESAAPGSPEFLGSTTQHQHVASADDPLIDYYWRVDTCFADGSILKGPVSRFKVRTLAFPTAEGYGRFAMGGRGGRVIEVTNLNDAGPGSLREAIEASGPRTIVFRVSGTIQLKSKLIIRQPYVTIAGQTAPGDGICIRGYTCGCLGAHDCIMRYVRLRIGDESGETMDGTGFASSDHCIFDHCSISWSIDEAVSSRSAKNITLQRCIISEALNIANHRKYQPGKGHSFAGSISGDVGSFHHNLLVHCAGRNWSLAGGLNRGGKFAGRLDVRNNVVYNWQHRTNDGGVKALNLVNNLYLPGPATKVFHLLKPDAGAPADPQQYFVSGNSMEGKFSATGDNWQDAVQVDSSLVPQIKLSEPFCESYVTTHSTDDLLENVLNDVGANHAGSDPLDRRLIDEVRHRSTTFQGGRSGLPGIIDSQTDVGGWPELKPGEPLPDRDHDGMDDAWEQAHNLNPEAADHNQPLPGGPTALEVYLQDLIKARPPKT